MKVMLDLSRGSSVINAKEGDKVIWEKRKGVITSVGKVMSFVNFPHSRPYRMIIETNLLERDNSND